MRSASLEALANAALVDREVVRLPDAPAQAGVVEARYSTRELLQTEAALIDGARARQHFAGIGSRATARRRP